MGRSSRCIRCNALLEATAKTGPKAEWWPFDGDGPKCRRCFCDDAAERWPIEEPAPQGPPRQPDVEPPDGYGWFACVKCGQWQVLKKSAELTSCIMTPRCVGRLAPPPEYKAKKPAVRRR